MSTMLLVKAVEGATMDIHPSKEGQAPLCLFPEPVGD